MPDTQPDQRSAELGLTLLNTLHALLSERSVTAAAARLGVSQPAVSRSLGHLRRYFDDPLLVRKPGGMVLTSRAEELLPGLSRWLLEGEALFRPKMLDPARLRRNFRIASTDYGVISVIGPVLDRISRAAPGVGLTISPLTPDSAAQLRHGELDFILSGFEPDHSLFHAKKLFSDRYTCLVRVDHPLLRLKKITPEDFMAWPQIVFMVLQKEAPDSGLEASGLDLTSPERRVVLRTQNAAVIPAMAAQSQAIALLPRRAIQAWGRQSADGPVPGMAELSPPFPVSDFDYWLLWHERNRRDPAIRWLLEQLSADAAGD